MMWGIVLMMVAGRIFAGKGRAAAIHANLTAPGRRATVWSMSRSFRAAFGVACVAAVCAASSCTVNQTLLISGDGSGTLTTHAEVSRLLQDYLASLSELSGRENAPKGVFDAAVIRKEFQSRPGVVVREVSTPTPASLDLELGFDSLADAVQKEALLSGVGAITLEEDGEQTTLRLHLDRSTYGQIAALFPPLQDPMIQQLGPQGTGNVTEQDYLSMIGFSIGEEAPGQLRRSFITLTVRPEGEIVSQSGGTVGGGAVVFRIPVLRVLVLDKPLDYSVTFRAGSQ